MRTIVEVGEALRTKKLSPVELTRHCLARIAQCNPSLNAFITVTPELALQQARQAEEEIMRGGWRGPLHGIPLGLKDLIDTAGIATTAASELYKHRIPIQHAEVVRKLEQAGAVVLGKHNLHEFAYGGSSLVSCFGEVRNPWKPAHIAGGSSGGSAAAVSADLCFGALGTDTGGSIRTPSSFCGVVGLKPTYGLVSIRGIIPLTLSLDHCGPITRTTGDAAVMLNVLAGYDKLDIASVEHPREDYVAAMKQPISGLRLGIPRAPFFDLLDADVEKAVEEAIGLLAKMTKGIKDVNLPSTRDINLNGESFAYHEELIRARPWPLSDPHPANASERWKLEGR